MIQMKTYMMTLKRMMMMALLLMVTVSAMADEQNIWLRITGNGKAQVSLDGKALTFDKDNKATVKGAEGLKVAVSVKPDNGYTVKSVTAQLTIDAGKAETRGADDASFLKVEQNVDGDYIFTMPEEFNVIISVTFTLSSSPSKGGSSSTINGLDYSGTYYIESASIKKKTLGEYYLCPTEGWLYYVATDTFTDEEDNGQPFLTTYQCKRDVNYEISKALWKIEKSGDYYTIKNVFHNKYIVYNGQISDAGANRIRVHLEDVDTPTQDGKELFVIGKNSAGKYVISPKNNSTNYFNVCQGNINSLAGSTEYVDNSKNDGPTTHKNDIHGTIGLYTAINDNNAPFFLQDYITRPSISYTSGNNVTITYSTEATIYYTTDGSDPTNSSTRQNFIGTSQTVSFTDDVAVVKAAAYIDGKYSNIAYYVYVHTGDSKPYLLQSVANNDFYMIAGDLNSSSKPTVNTSSLPQTGMSWHFEDAGIVNNVQCYYVYNTAAQGYLRRDANNFYIQSTYADNNDYKFAVIPYLNDSGILGGFYLYNIGKAQYVYKGTSNNVVGNGSDGAVNLTTTADQDVARWNLILVANKSFPSPVTLSDNSSATYYTFASLNTPAQLITPPTGTSTYVKTSSGENDKQKWYFKDAGTDGWASYYYIINGQTGEAMYFGQDAANTTIQNALEMRALPETPTDNYKFALAHTVTDGEYYIVPKPLAQFTKTKYAAVWYVDTTTPLQTQSNRASKQIKWQISEVVDYVAPPYITYDITTNTATISSTYPGATIYYTTDGTEATTSSTNTVTPVDPIPTVSTSFVLDAGISTIRAIVSKDGIGTSSESTYSIAFQLTLTDAAADLRPYIIQSQSNVNFYMIPGDDVNVGEDPNKITKVNTTTLFRPTMEWYFKNAGVADGVQYYYIVNKGNNKNLCYDTENTANGVYMDSNSDNSNKFKFQIKATASTYNIVPYGLTTGNMYLNKKGGNAGADALMLYSNAADANSLWKFVPSADLDKTAPFDVPDASSTPYYKIASVGSNGYYIVPPSGTVTNATTSNSSDAEVVKTMNWYFEVAQAATDADWCTYYHIRNVLTDEYLYFAKDDNNDGACLEMKSTIEAGEEDRYMFTWARTTETDKYYIIPKKVKDKSLNQISSLQRDNATLKSNLTRSAGNLAWTFNPSYICLNPSIAYVPGAETGTVEMTCATKPSKIYYTKDGSNPANSSTRAEYNSEQKPSYTDVAQIYIKAIAVLDNSEHEAVSDLITFIKNPTVTFQDENEYDYEYNNDAKEPQVTSVTVGTDNTIINASEYSVTYGANINAGPVTVTIGDAKENNLFISGTTTFNILPRSLGDGTTAADGILITVTRTVEATYTLTIKNGSLTLVEDTDYSLSEVTSDASGYRATITAVENSNYIGGARIIYVRADFPTATDEHSGGMAAAYQASIDLAAPSDMKAYIVTGIDYTAGTVTVQELAYIPNGVPVLLLTNDGSGHDADFTASAYTVVDVADVSDNILKRSDVDDGTTGTIYVDWGQYYIFSKGEFVLSMGGEGKKMKVGKFYIENDKYSSGGASTRALSIRRGTRDGTSTINGVVSQSDKEFKSPIWYTLEGQMLNQKPTRKGIYIHNGHKIIVK